MLEGIFNNQKYWILLVLLHWDKAEIKATRINLSSNMGGGRERGRRKE
jgi:hypothetical protein